MSADGLLEIYSVVIFSDVSILYYIILRSCVPDINKESFDHWDYIIIVCCELQVILLIMVAEMIALGGSHGNLQPQRRQVGRVVKCGYL